LWRKLRYRERSLNMDKRGIAPVIATILIVLLTIVAVSILAAFIIPFVRENLQKGTECLPYREYFTFDESFDYNCFDAQGKHGISVKAGTATKAVSDKISGFELVFIAEGEGKKLSAREGNSTSGLKILRSTDINIKIPKPGEIITYVREAENNKKYTSVEVYPTLASGAICEKSDAIKLILCGASITLN